MAKITDSKIIRFIEKRLQEDAKTETLKTLGDRSTYVGSSDLGCCARKTVLSKLNPKEHSLDTLIRFRRGHMTESIIAASYDKIGDYYSGWQMIAQQEVIHPDYKFMQAHIDFIFYDKDFSSAKIIECKSCSGIPDDAYPSWDTQINWQIGLAKLSLFKDYPDINISGSILAFDLNTGEIAEFNGYTHNEFIFNASVDKAIEIMDAVTAGDENLVKAEEDFMCSFCQYKSVCTNYHPTDAIADPDTLELVKEYYMANEAENHAKRKLNNLKANLYERIGKKPLKVSAGDFIIKITSVAGSISTVCDTDKLRTDYPDVADKVLSIQRVAGYSKIQVTKVIQDELLEVA